MKDLENRMEEQDSEKPTEKTLSVDHNVRIIRTGPQMTELEDLTEKQDFTELTPETLELAFNNARALRASYFNSAQDYNTNSKVTVRYHSVQDLKKLMAIITASNRFRPMKAQDVKPYEVYLYVHTETDDYNNRHLSIFLGRFKPRKKQEGLQDTYGFVITPQEIEQVNNTLIRNPEQLENDYGKNGNRLILTIPPTISTRDIIQILEKAKKEQESYHIHGVPKLAKPLELPFESLRDIYTMCHGIKQSGNKPLTPTQIVEGTGYLHLFAQLLELDRGILQVTRGRLTTHDGKLYDHTGAQMPEDIKARIAAVSKDNTKLIGTPLYLHCYT